MSIYSNFKSWLIWPQILASWYLYKDFKQKACKVFNIVCQDCIFMLTLWENWSVVIHIFHIHLDSCSDVHNRPIGKSNKVTGWYLKQKHLIVIYAATVRSMSPEKNCAGVPSCPLWELFKLWLHKNYCFHKNHLTCNGYRKIWWEVPVLKISG
jgi:hypothetical protein